MIFIGIKGKVALMKFRWKRTEYEEFVHVVKVTPLHVVVEPLTGELVGKTLHVSKHCIVAIDTIPDYEGAGNGKETTEVSRKALQKDWEYLQCPLCGEFGHSIGGCPD